MFRERMAVGMWRDISGNKGVGPVYLAGDRVIRRRCGRNFCAIF
jgi:hypothetical protein